MSELRLRFSDGDQPDLVVGAGVHALGRLPTGLGPVDAEQPWLLRVSNDRRGLWLTVAEGLRGVHVNGRPVQHVAMLRAGANIVGYELREDFATRAQANVERFLGAEAMSRYRVELRDCYDGIDETDMDRVVLDLPEPWRVVPHAALALRPGGIIVGYSPSIMQVTQFRDALDASGFMLAETIEVLHRGWHIEGAAVRPDHRMVAHTGFLTTARRGRAR